MSNNEGGIDKKKGGLEEGQKEKQIEVHEEDESEYEEEERYKYKNKNGVDGDVGKQGEGEEYKSEY